MKDAEETISMSLHEELNTNLLQGHQECQRLNTMIRKTKSTQAFLIWKRDEAKKDLEAYVNKMSESLINFRSDMHVSIKTVFNEKVQETVQIREKYQGRIKSLMSLCEEMESLVQFGKNLTSSADQQTARKLLNSFSGVVECPTDAVDYDRLIKFQFCPAITTDSIDPSMFGQLIKGPSFNMTKTKLTHMKACSLPSQIEKLQLDASKEDMNPLTKEISENSTQTDLDSTDMDKLCNFNRPAYNLISEQSACICSGCSTSFLSFESQISPPPGMEFMNMSVPFNTYCTEQSQSPPPGFYPYSGTMLPYESNCQFTSTCHNASNMYAQNYGNTCTLTNLSSDCNLPVQINQVYTCNDSCQRELLLSADQAMAHPTVSSRTSRANSLPVDSPTVTMLGQTVNMDQNLQQNAFKISEKKLNKSGINLTNPKEKVVEMEIISQTDGILLASSKERSNKTSLCIDDVKSDLVCVKSDENLWQDDASNVMEENHDVTQSARNIDNKAESDNEPIDNIERNNYMGEEIENASDADKIIKFEELPRTNGLTADDMINDFVMEKSSEVCCKQCSYVDKLGSAEMWDVDCAEVLQEDREILNEKIAFETNLKKKIGGGNEMFVQLKPLRKPRLPARCRIGSKNALMLESGSCGIGVNQRDDGGLEHIEVEGNVKQECVESEKSIDDEDDPDILDLSKPAGKTLHELIRQTHGPSKEEVTKLNRSTVHAQTSWMKGYPQRNFSDSTLNEKESVNGSSECETQDKGISNGSVTDVKTSVINTPSKERTESLPTHLTDYWDVDDAEKGKELNNNSFGFPVTETTEIQQKGDTSVNMDKVESILGEHSLLKKKDKLEESHLGKSVNQKVEGVTLNHEEDSPTRLTRRKDKKNLFSILKSHIGDDSRQMSLGQNRLGSLQNHWLKNSPGTNVKARLLFNCFQSFCFPIGVATLSSLVIIVADTGNDCMKMLDQKGKLIRVFGKDLPIALKRPSAIAINEFDDIFVKDDICIRVFDKQGSYVKDIARDVFTKPYGLVITPDKKLLVLDTDRHHPTLVHISQDGRKVMRFPYAPLIPVPAGSKCRFMDISENRVVVSDLGLSKIYVTSQDGQFLKKFGSYGSGPMQFVQPSGISVDNYGNMVIGDSKNNRVQVYRHDGTYIGLVDFDEKVIRPSGLHLTSDNRLIVVSYLQHCIKVYQL